MPVSAQFRALIMRLPEPARARVYESHVLQFVEYIATKVKQAGIHEANCHILKTKKALLGLPKKSTKSFVLLMNVKEVFHDMWESCSVDLLGKMVLSEKRGYVPYMCSQLLDLIEGCKCVNESTVYIC
jgi:hypothetical protein